MTHGTIHAAELIANLRKEIDKKDAEIASLTEQIIQMNAINEAKEEMRAITDAVGKLIRQFREDVGDFEKGKWHEIISLLKAATAAVK